MTSTVSRRPGGSEGPAVAVDGVHSSTLRSVVWLTRRNLVRVTRLPSIIIPVAVMPLFFVIAFTGSFDGVSNVPGYPTNDVINWVAAFALIQGSSFAGVGAAGVMANDLDGGFIDRLLVSPIRRDAILIAPLVYTAIRAVVPITIVLVAAAIKGAAMPGGFLGVLLVYVGGVGFGVVIGAFGLAVVMRMNDIKAMSFIQMMSFLFLFPSIGQMPLVLISGWLHTVARINPVTNVLRMTRQGFLGPVTWTDTWPGLLALGLGLLVFGAWSRFELERRIP